MDVPEINRADNNDRPHDGLRLSTSAVSSGGDGGVCCGVKDRLHGCDEVLSVVVALYTLQQQRRRGEDPAPSVVVAEKGAAAAVDDKGSSSSSSTFGAVLLSSAKGVAATGAGAAGAGAAVTEDVAAGVDGWEREAGALVAKLRALRDAYPSEVEFYLPQLCIVVALGDFARPSALVELLLELCESDLRLAHKTHWFLKSFCTGAGTSPAPLGLSSFALRVQQRGCMVASRLSRELGRQAVIARLCDRDIGKTDGNTDGTRSEEPSLASGDGNRVCSKTEGGDIIDGVGDGGDAGGAGVAGGVRAKAEGERSARRATDVDVTVQSDVDGEEEAEEDSLAEHYDPAMFFVEALVGLSEQLGELSSKKRAKGLQEGLERINEFFLSDRAQGSDVIYVPFGGGFHQIRAIHPRESMHFSTKERVPLLVCLEVQEVRVPTRLSRVTSTTKKATAVAGEPLPSSDNIGRSVGDTGVSACRGDVAVEVGGTEEGAEQGTGEGGLMERFRGTVHSFVKLKSEDESAMDDDDELPRNSEGGDDAGYDHEKSRPVSPLVRLDDSIEGDECSSRTASDADASNTPLLSDGSAGVSPGGTGYHRQQQQRQRRKREASGLRAPRQTPPATTILGSEGDEAGCAYCSSSSSPDDGDINNNDNDDDDDYGGNRSQGGFWYGEGGGASALEAAMGQWGGDYVDAAAAAADGVPCGDGDARRGQGGEEDVEDDGEVVVASVLGLDGEEAPTSGEVDPASGAVGNEQEEEEEEEDSWELVNAPPQWEDISGEPSGGDGGRDILCRTGGAGSSNPDSQSDSYSEYLAAAEAERLDRQLATEAEEREATLEAEKLSRAWGEEDRGSRSHGQGGGQGHGRRSSFAATSVLAGIVSAGGGAGGGRRKAGRRKRVEAVVGAGKRGGCAASRPQEQQQQQQQQPRIIFKEQWREKEIRVWQEGAGSAAGGRGLLPSRGGVRAGISSDGSGKGESGRGLLSSSSSPRKGWKLLPIIVKANDNLRQEQFVSHLVAVFDQIFKAAKLGARLRPYEIMATSPTAGVIEAVPDTVSLDALKRHTPHLALHEFFRRHFGKRGMLRQARANFVESCAAYSVVCFLLQIKDRHNGNLLLSADGHFVHIDWGFALDLSPGGNLGFESAPFKLTQEFVEVMGGARSTSFQAYRSLCIRTFLEARRSRDKIMTLVELMVAFRPDLACFGGRPDAVLKHLRARFQPDMTAEECVAFVHDLIEQSLDNWRTRLFDTYQRAFVGIQ